MNSQNNDEDSMNFSVIDKNPEAQPIADFSVRQLLGDAETPAVPGHPATLSMQKSVEDVFSKIKKMQVGSGHSMLKSEHKGSDVAGNNFLRDLSRMQKELSFESEAYNIYEQGQSVSEVLQNNKSKTQSALKVTKQSTNKSTNKSTSKEQCFYLNQYFGPLIIDFKKDHKPDHHPAAKNQYLKYHRQHTKRSKNDSNNSQLSSDYSSGYNQKKANNKSSSKEGLPSFFGPRGKSKSSRNLLEVADFKKSKSKSHNSKLRGVSKSQSNLKISSETENYSSKVFTQYYGTDIHVTQKKPDIKMKKQTLSKVRSSQKTSRSKHKLGLLSPRAKMPTKPMPLKK